MAAVLGYPKEVYDGAWQTLAERARAAQETESARREEIRSVVPEIARIESELAASARAVTRAVALLKGEVVEAQVARLQEQNLALQKKRAELLRGNGYPPDYLARQYGCSACRDTGYAGSRMCACLRDLLKKEAYARLSAVSGAGECSFENFLLRHYSNETDGAGVAPRKRMAQIAEFCRRYAEEYSPASESLLMIGRTGLGKTHLSLAIAAAVTGKGYGVVYSPVQRIIDRLEFGKFARNTEDREQYMDNMTYALECDLLVLDDLGTEFHTQFSSSLLYSIINSRMAENRPTIISTNLELAQIEEKYSQRMVSRLVCSYKALKFYGKDIRFIKKSETR